MRPLSIPYESEVLLPICYQIFDGDPDKGVDKYFTRTGLRRVFDCEELEGVASKKYSESFICFCFVPPNERQVPKK